jgi:hypothetical protein
MNYPGSEKLDEKMFRVMKAEAEKGNPLAIEFLKKKQGPVVEEKTEHDPIDEESFLPSEDGGMASPPSFVEDADPKKFGPVFKTERYGNGGVRKTLTAESL